MSFFQQLQHETEAERQQMLSLPVIRETMEGQLTLERYLAFLTQAYHHVRHTVPLMMACGSRLSESQNWMQPALVEYIEEEVGHEKWILNDVRAIGGSAEDVIGQGPAFETEMMVAYAYYSIERINPICFFGMVLVLEGTSIALADRVADAVQGKLGLPAKAFSYLRSHGSLDQEHIKLYEELVNRIESTQDQQDLIHAARRHYRLYGAVLNSLA
ncbi:TenA family transcriptional regulator [Aestuariirhabdus litorea]|uniref:Biliverdin-producing heme oxygenase n=1 Tax=Aestuariirhabdus litorea TaxID=2528527 RepID=A0A3P3VNM7_9GAMM|nr:iron-containing redox enzyme family protein [Aestuariirhabdus litorea]RRJ84024.1 biliverdin-producing heme oxygenase [Aestuariirhabdus litorea]RWW97244.1 biliverdin-producing heme oxygenase [Endozoicomonadaceae bacterium GTF-13]